MALLILPRVTRIAQSESRAPGESWWKSRGRAGSPSAAPRGPDSLEEGAGCHRRVTAVESGRLRAVRGNCVFSPCAVGHMDAGLTQAGKRMGKVGGEHRALAVEAASGVADRCRRTSRSPKLRRDS